MRKGDFEKLKSRSEVFSSAHQLVKEIKVENLGEDM